MISDPFIFLEMHLPVQIYEAVLVYFMGGMVLALFGWIPLLPLARRICSFSPTYRDFVRDQLHVYSFMLNTDVWYLTPSIASGVVQQGFWGRSFRKNYPDEARRIAEEYRMSLSENIYSRFMLLHTLTICLMFAVLLICILLAKAVSMFGVG